MFPVVYDFTLRLMFEFFPDVNLIVPLLKYPPDCDRPHNIVDPVALLTVEVTAIDVRLNVQFVSPKTQGHVG